jgi:sigma-54 specific flagellar transcriptional regulator A
VTDTKVVVIECDQAKALSWEMALRFLHYEPIVVADIGALDWPSADQLDWVAIMFGQAGSRGAMAELLTRLREFPAGLPVVCPAGSETLDAASGALQLELELPVRYAQLSAVLGEARRLRAARDNPHAHCPSGSSPAIRQVHHLAGQVASFDTNVLILGESGTGKEMVARHIHELSARRSMPFVPVNCGAIPPDLLESELFGHEKGAFTGALTTRAGRFEFAEGGTLFLDEIGDMPPAMQVKLLRVLQERNFERVGSNRTQHCNVRVIAATHRDLEAAIAAGSFREDLYYRLNVFPITVPPLRERIADLPALVAHLSHRLEGSTGRRVSISPEALAELGAYPWPGNVRELGNLLERLVILHPGESIGPAQLPERYRCGRAAAVPPAPGGPASLPAGGIDLKEHLAQLEVSMIRGALKHADGTVAEAARLLNLRRTTLVEKLRKYQLES